MKLLKWIKGWAKLFDGLIIIVTLGLIDPDLTSKAHKAILKELFRDFN